MTRPLKTLITHTIIALMLCSLLTGCRSNKITGNDLFVMQANTFDNITAYSNEMDDVITLYVMGSITVDDFANELTMLDYQLRMIDAAYKKVTTDNPIEPGSHSYLSKKGIDALEGMITTFDTILDHVVGQDGKPLSQSDVAYVYLAYQDKITHYVAEYMVSATALTDTTDE